MLYLHTILKLLNVETNLINISDIKSAIGMKGVMGTAVGTAAMSILGLNGVNKLYSNFYDKYGKEFTEQLLIHFQVYKNVISSQLENIPKEGPFIIVSNHPFGAFDGIILFDVVSAIRPDFKILTNFILSHIKNLSDSFLPVNPFSDMKGMKNSYGGVRAAKEHIINGGGLGLFPAGEVSTYHGNGYTEDIEWSQSMAKLIKNSGVPVIPVYFDGENSKIFHILGKVHPLLRTAQLPREMLKRQTKTVYMRIGKPISATEISEHSIASLRKYLRNRSYALEAQITTQNGEEKLRKQEDETPIAQRRDPALLSQEIEKIAQKGGLLYETGNYSCFLADYDDIPELICEIGIRREESFRDVGEGTGLAMDLDDFDKYYKHLILWDSSKKELAGAYRLGIGKDIMSHYGINGFYSNTLFKFSQKFSDTLSHSIELGRSFVSLNYKKEALPLLLLIKGLMYSVVRYKDCEYLFGPVSISSSYPIFYRSLMYHYITEEHSLDFLKENITARVPFKPNFLRVNPSDLLETKTKTIETFDRFLLRLSDNQFRLPTLVKKYLKLGAKITCFNVDKSFNYCVDGLVFLKISDVPKEEILQLTKGSDNPKEILSRFNFD